ncbi:phage tail protein [Bosea minatitlanensis]|uniref:Phage tail protein n=1 Tax=Bosea minatitlanensis TaxID=128782 RepID=A0ABW0F0A1_9HYPH|nr:phage tail protein [Bosea minatitlanensis]MCT4491818.1 phage tail protein [Bosea minatitlanensis]
MSAVLAIGPHVFEILPLSLQKLSERTKMNWPATKRFGVGPARQLTGRDEDTFDIEGVYYDQEFGGHAEYLALKATQSAGEPVELIGWAAGGGAASVFGTVVILEVGAEHSYLHTTGIGRKVEFDVKLAPFGGDGGPFGGLF